MYFHPASHQIPFKHHIFLCFGHLKKYCPPSRRVNCSDDLWIAVACLTVITTTLGNLFFVAVTVTSHCTFTSSLSHGSASSSKPHLLPLPADSQTTVRSWNPASFRDSKRCQLAKLITLITKGWNGSSMSWLNWSWAVVLNANLMQN